MNKDEVKAAQEALGLSDEKFAQAIGLGSGRTVRRWKTGEFRMHESKAILIRRLVAEAELKALKLKSNPLRWPTKEDAEFMGEFMGKLGLGKKDAAE